MLKIAFIICFVFIGLLEIKLRSGSGIIAFLTMWGWKQMMADRFRVVLVMMEHGKTIQACYISSCRWNKMPGRWWINRELLERR